ncbi:hypothetical protein DEA8626_01117 [Defluviimonas aquaemixtae]|uniref:DUF995 domain-containing protein n=1 Tax=Albidovulum aquaemixtae TaxID=1542388 RepID=A0A2R8B4P7_9RHOB|nr:hypothetical protein [Defluviimonas aquaemixtae]SPH17594.1 hypothetical protein DEA8626_01117 [Defluviimonas aquaemixtae]
MRRWAMVCGLIAGLAGPVAAEDWQALDAAAILQALTGRSLAYEDGARQDFRDGGGTTYRAGAGESEGRWRAESGRYCSVWPPSERWSCYALERDTETGRLRFVGSAGDITVGAYQEK